MNTTLVIMAAGIGSRYGNGIKQLEKVGPSGEIIMDYSIHDALKAGFNKVIFIIRRDLDKEFREIIGNRIEKICKVEYAYQELTNLPNGFTCPNERKKPWGTGQAVLACKGLINEPFCVINADDYYGKDAYVTMHDYLVSGNAKYENGKFRFCLVGYDLKNTLSDNGGVTRGICKVENNKLVGIEETKNIVKVDGHGKVKVSDDEYRDLPVDATVSMNMWGFSKDYIDYLEKGFSKFLSEMKPDDFSSEYLVPTVVGGMIKEGIADIDVLYSHDRWFGVTYHEDKESVVNEIKSLTDKGIYLGNGIFGDL